MDTNGRKLLFPAHGARKPAVLFVLRVCARDERVKAEGKIVS